MPYVTLLASFASVIGRAQAPAGTANRVAPNAADRDHVRGQRADGDGYSISPAAGVKGCRDEDARDPARSPRGRDRRLRNLLRRVRRPYVWELVNAGASSRRNAFPSPGNLANLDPQALRDLGFSFRKATTMIELSRDVVSGRLDLEGLEQLGDDEVVSKLTSLTGIGRWNTSCYVVLDDYTSSPATMSAPETTFHEC
jgi:hypothetical protein